MSGSIASSGSVALIDVGEIAGMLDARIESLAAYLLPNGKRDGHEWRVGSLGGEPGRSLAVHIGGAKAGVWKDFAGGQGGDGLDLVAAVLFGADKKDAIRWAKSWLGIDGADPGRLRQHRIEAKAARETRDAAAADETRRKRGAARKLWHEGVPIAGTPAEAYLAARGIDLRALGRAPGILRYHGEVWCAERRAPHPAMLAGVLGLDGEQVAVHRTYLSCGGPTGADLCGGPTASPRPAPPAGAPGWPVGGAAAGQWTKASIATPKKVLGGFAGGHIPLWKGAHRQTLRDVPAGTAIYVSEGIEDGLTAACADPSLRVVAAVSLGNLGALALPAQAGPIVIIGQNDGAGSEAASALARAIAAQRARGLRVMIARPPAGVKDVNELATRAIEGVAA